MKESAASAGNPRRLRTVFGLLGLVLARLLAPAASFLITVLVARFWGQTLLGRYNTIWVWLTISLNISLFGVAELISREIGANTKDVSRHQTHGLLFAFSSSSICALLMAVGVFFFDYPEEVTQSIRIAAVALPFSACSLIALAVFTAFQKSRFIALAWTLESLLFLISGAIVVLKSASLAALVRSLVASRALACALNLFLTHSRIAPIRLSIDAAFLRKLLAPLAVFGVTGACFQIFMRIDVIMLSVMTDMDAVGLYSSAGKIMEVCLILPSTFYLLNLPQAARGFRESGEGIRKELEAAVKQLFMLVFLAVSFGLVFSESILTIIYGEAFRAGASALSVLMLSFLAQSAEMILAMSCQAGGLHVAAMYFSIGRAVANILLNLALIPLWGILGSAFATFLSILLSFLALQRFVSRRLVSFPWVDIMGKPAAVALLSALMALPFREHLSALILGPLFVVVYGCLLFAWGGFPPGILRRS